MNKLSNLELNKAIAKALGYTCHKSDNGDKVWIRKYNRSTGETDYFGLVDYCNNWNDLMPLVVEYLLNDCKALSITNDGVLTSNQGKAMGGLMLEIEAETLQRALAECLLKVLQEKRGDDIK